MHKRYGLREGLHNYFHAETSITIALFQFSKHRRIDNESDLQTVTLAGTENFRVDSD